MNDITWIDTHVHVCDTGGNGARRPRFFEDLLAVLDADDADLRFVISPDTRWLRHATEESGGVLRANTLIHDLVERAPGRLYGSCLVNPHFLAESLAAMEKAFEKWGFVQLGEMLQYMMDYEMDTDACEELVRQAVKYGVPVQVHISTSNSPKQGNTSGMGELFDLFGVVDRVPEAQYILAHLVGTPDDNPPVVDAYLDAIDSRYGTWPDNFWAEVRDFNSPGVRSLLERAPATRILAGTDWCTRLGPPFLPYGVTFRTGDSAENDYDPRVSSLVGFLREAGASDDAIRRIASGNAAGLLGIDL